MPEATENILRREGGDIRRRGYETKGLEAEGEAIDLTQRRGAPAKGNTLRVAQSPRGWMVVTIEHDPFHLPTGTV